MEKYVLLLSYEVMDTVKAGKTVYVLDRKHNEVYRVNSLEVSEFAEILVADDISMRYEFWYAEKGDLNG